MADENFCCVENFSVLIPYKDLEKLMKTAQNAEKSLQEVKRMEKRMEALKGQVFELMLKVKELEEII